MNTYFHVLPGDVLRLIEKLIPICSTPFLPLLDKRYRKRKPDSIKRLLIAFKFNYFRLVKHYLYRLTEAEKFNNAVVLFNACSSTGSEWFIELALKEFNYLANISTHEERYCVSPNFPLPLLTKYLSTKQWTVTFMTLTQLVKKDQADKLAFLVARGQIKHFGRNGLGDTIISHALLLMLFHKSMDGKRACFDYLYSHLKSTGLNPWLRLPPKTFVRFIEKMKEEAVKYLDEISRESYFREYLCLSSKWRELTGVSPNYTHKMFHSVMLYGKMEDFTNYLQQVPTVTPCDQCTRYCTRNKSAIHYLVSRVRFNEGEIANILLNPAFDPVDTSKLFKDSNIAHNFPSIEKVMTRIWLDTFSLSRAKLGKFIDDYRNSRDPHKKQAAMVLSLLQ